MSLGIKLRKLECGPMPNVMGALPNIGGALCSTPQSLAQAHTRVACSNAAKTRKPLKFAGVPQTPEPISAASGPYCGDVWRRYYCLTSFFPIVDTYQLRRFSPTNLCSGAQMAIFWQFLAFCIFSDRVQHISGLHSKFALRPHHV